MYLLRTLQSLDTTKRTPFKTANKEKVGPKLLESRLI